MYRRNRFGGTFYGSFELALKGVDVQKQFLLIKHLGDAMRETRHLVHVVRYRANDAIQFGKLLAECRGKSLSGRRGVLQS